MSSQLHLISRPITQEQLNQQLSFVSEGDGIVFMQDSCYSLQAPSIQASLAYQNFEVYAVSRDMKARNINYQQVNIVNYQQLVQLSLQYDKTISW